MSSIVAPARGLHLIIVGRPRPAKATGATTQGEDGKRRNEAAHSRPFEPGRQRVKQMPNRRRNNKWRQNLVQQLDHGNERRQCRNPERIGACDVHMKALTCRVSRATQIAPERRKIGACLNVIGIILPKNNVRDRFF
jgi:hypothetical protein